MRILRSVPAAAEAPVALTIGNFDGVHLGHQAMLARLHELATERALPPCAMTFEPHPREFFAPDKAPARLTSLREKLECLSRCGLERVYVMRFDYRFAQIPPEEFIERVLVRSLGVKRLLVGDDFRFGARRAGDFALLKTYSEKFGYDVEAMRTVTLDRVRVSSTAVRDALAAGDLARAHAFLGRPYGMSGRVVPGDGLGRRLGFPTANVRVNRVRVPLMGIFAVEVDIGGDTPQRGVASLGIRPTVKAQGEPVLRRTSSISTAIFTGATSTSTFFTSFVTKKNFRTFRRSRGRSAATSKQRARFSRGRALPSEGLSGLWLITRKR